MYNIPCGDVSQFVTHYSSERNLNNVNFSLVQKKFTVVCIILLGYDFETVTIKPVLSSLYQIGSQVIFLL